MDMHYKQLLDRNEVSLISPKDLPVSMQEHLVDTLLENASEIPEPRKAVAQLFVLTELFENIAELKTDYQRKLVLAAQLIYARGYDSLISSIEGMTFEDLMMPKPTGTQPAKPDVDTTFVWNAPFAPPSVSDIKIYYGQEHTIALVSERSDNTSRSLTNGAEYAIQQAIERFQLDPTTLIWIQHEPENVHGYKNTEEYSIVDFNWNHQENRFKNPQWKHLSIEKLTSMLHEI